MAGDITQYVVVVEDERQASEAEAAAEAAGAVVRHRFGRVLVFQTHEEDEAQLREALPPGVMFPVDADLDASRVSQLGSLEQLAVRAAALRSSRAFREEKAKRPHEDVEWGTGGLPEPDAFEDHEESTGDAGTATARGPAPAQDTAPPPLNERLINGVAVGIVIVDGAAAEANITEEEKDRIVAETMEGLGWLGDFEPDARVSWTYEIESVTVDIPWWKGARWRGMPDTFYEGIDAAVLREDNGRIYFFKDDEYVRFSSVFEGVDAGYPKPIAGNWPGLPETFQDGIDAALWRESNDAIYFFKGAEYVRFSKVSDGIDAGYPKPIAANWPGMPVEFNEGIDAALLRKDNGKIYFFKGGQYVRFSDVSAGVDAGYPKPIETNWQGLPDKFNEGIDAALWRNSNGAVYFFKKGRFYGQYVRFSEIANGMDAGYPVAIGLSTEEAEAQWRDPALAALGFGPGKDGVKDYVAALRSSLQTKSGFAQFVTKHPTTWHAYAYTPKVVLRYSTSSNWDRVIAHESGHMFGAPDEYESSNCKCGTKFGRFFSAPNDNCANCSPDPADPCIMRKNSAAMCPYTPNHVGWGGFLSRVDAATARQDLGRIYLFSNDWYVQFTDVSSGRDPGFPALISSNWPGLPDEFCEGLDAALWRKDNGRMYLFKGSKYARFSTDGGGPDAGYPAEIGPNWPGLPDSFKQGIDAALWRESNGKIYFFKGAQYVRFSNISDGVDPGYPQKIKGNWPGLPVSYNQGIDAALMRWDNHKIYLFKDRGYVRYTSVDAGPDPGYPAWIDGNWMPFPR